MQLFSREGQILGRICRHKMGNVVWDRDAGAMKECVLLFCTFNRNTFFIEYSRCLAVDGKSTGV